MEQQLTRQLGRTAKALHEHVSAVLADKGASVTTWIVLSILTNNEGLSQHELADRMGVTGPTMCRHLERLEAQGLVVRRRDPHDRRVLRVERTEAGRRHHAEVRLTMDAVDEEFRSVLTADEVAIMLRLLVRLRDHAKEPYVAAS